MNIESLVSWSQPDNGVRVGSCGSAFWKAWSSNKAELKAAGVSCHKNDAGDWVAAQRVPKNPQSVAYFQAVKEAAAESAAQASAAAVVPAPSGRVWSAEQQAIFEHFAGVQRNAVVRARAGTGKTTTIQEAFKHAPEESMLYCVFNKKNQVEAQAKIRDQRVEIKTLHSLGFMFIKQMWPAAKPDSSLEKDRAKIACGQSAPDAALSAVVRLVSFSKNMFLAPSLAELVELADCRGIDCQDFEDLGWTVEKLAACALQVLELSKVQDIQGRISFDDMVWLPVAMNWVHAWYELVVVDEAQDMNLPQLIMARKACHEGGRVIVVGDDRQAIYGFRGAAQNGMDMMKNELNAVELSLTITYRCPKCIVALAAEMVPDYRAADSAPEGSISFLGAGILASTVQIGDAIISRANAPLMPICLQLLRAGVPARIEGKDIGRQLLGIVKSLRAKSVPNFLFKLNAWGQKQRNRVSKSEHAEERCGVINDQVAVLVAVAEGVSAVSEIEARLFELFQDTDGFSKPAVVLSSVHKAKGLEWNRVFLLSKTFKPGAEGEEQNIRYVAVTRAKQALVWVSDERPEEND
jgi:hypothetical protein